MPLDLWIYQEIMWERRPDVVIEIGSFAGGSSLALAHMMDNVGKGRIISMDIRLDKNVPKHPRIQFIEVDAMKHFDAVKATIKPEETVMVIEDSSHYQEHTYTMLKQYGQLVKVGDYFIVEDTLVWHGLDEGPKPGPWEGVEKFLKESDDFVSDRSREGFILTWNPRGFLKRVK
jgi:cephalosporin hydroxylase